MKKLLGIVVLGLVLFATSADALKTKKTKFRTGQIYEGNIVYEGGVNINLPDGKWTMLGRWNWTVSAVRADGITLGILEDNILKGLIDMTHVDSGGKWIGYVNDWIRSVYIVNKIDGCYMSVVGLPICELIQLLNSTGLLGKVGLKIMSEDFDQCTYCPLTESIC